MPKFDVGAFHKELAVIQKQAMRGNSSTQRENSSRMSSLPPAAAPIKSSPLLILPNFGKQIFHGFFWKSIHTITTQSRFCYSNTGSKELKESDIFREAVNVRESS